MPALSQRLVRSVFLALLLGGLLVAPAAAQESEEGASEAQSAPSNIEQRLRRIEDSLIDMRAMIGALQSFAPGDGAASGQDGAMPEGGMSAAPDPFGDTEQSLAEPAPQPSVGANPQLQQLEIQVQALSAQLSETVTRLDRLEAAMRQGDASEVDGAPQPSADDADADLAAAQDTEADVETGFGTTTVQTPTAPEDDFGVWEDETMSAPADEAGNPDAQAMFTQAFDALQAEDYAAAREGFEQFLDTYPDDPLANDARYWLADAAFAEGDYVVAANNFVKVYNTAPTGEKSEETLLKLAVVLRRLDRPESACDALSRLDGRLHGMPENFRERVDNERRRSGCG